MRVYSQGLAVGRGRRGFSARGHDPSLASGLDAAEGRNGAFLHLISDPGLRRCGSRSVASKEVTYRSPLAAQDVALSRRKQGFESPWERQRNQRFRPSSPDPGLNGYGNNTERPLPNAGELSWSIQSASCDRARCFSAHHLPHFGRQRPCIYRNGLAYRWASTSGQRRRTLRDNEVRGGANKEFFRPRQPRRGEMKSRGLRSLYRA